MAPPRDHPTRRALLVGGGAAAGLVLAWELWPRAYAPNLSAGPGETVLGAFLRIAADGRVTVAVPQAELGQGVWTALPQALADELGADWRQVGVEPAPLDPLYANRLLAAEWGVDALPPFLRGVERWAASTWATRHDFQVTAGSTSIRMFEQPFREAGATARALLCMAAGRRIGADWRACDTDGGFVTRGADRFRFGELAAEAAGFAPPDPPPLRRAGDGRLSGRPVPRLDAPAKLDGTLRYAGDVRLPNMVFAAIRHGPAGETRLAAQDLAAGDDVAGVIGVVRSRGWIAALAQTSWEAERALERMHPRFATAGPLADDAAIARALDQALAVGGTRLASAGEPDKVLAGPGLVTARYAIPFAAHAAVEPLVATARVTGDRLEIWTPTQAATATRDAVAAATGFRAGRINVYPAQAGGSFGRKIEQDAAIEAALLAIHARRPLQLTWSRGEEMRAGRHRAPARAVMTARLSPGGRIAGWGATIATPATMRALAGRLGLPGGGGGAEQAALDGAAPPYAVSALSLAHAPAAIGIATGLWRGGMRDANAFFTESFADELAAASGVDPLSFRMGLLGAQPRLARCLSQAAASGGWSGEPRAGQGLACHAAYGSNLALFAEAGLAGGRIAVSRLVAVVDCGRIINPTLVRQQIEGGLIWGLAQALGNAVTWDGGLPRQAGLDALHLPRLADTPEIEVELVESTAPPGGVSELAGPLVAPAIANAIASAAGRRLRSTPLSA